MSTATAFSSRDGARPNRPHKRPSPARLFRRIAKSVRDLAGSTWIFRGLFVAAAVVGIAFAWRSFDGGRGSDAALRASAKLVVVPVQRAELRVDVTERGTLASQQETRVVCELETVSGQSGSRILWLAPNGAQVKKGDLLVEFDSAALRERLNSQMVVFETSNATKIQANAKFENQKTLNETNLATAKLRLETANLAKTMYEDGAGGSYRISLTDLNAKIQEAKNQISEAQAALRMKSARRQGVEALFKLGYRGKGDLDQATHEHLQADFALAKAANALSASEAAKRKLEKYEYPMKVLELDGAIATAKRALSQVERDNESLLAQASAAKNAAERALVTETERLEKLKVQLEKCKVVAPHDGLVAHSPDRTPWGRVVGDGELVTERFKILSLPELTRMQARIAIHESTLDDVRPGQTATIRIDADSHVTYEGTVRSVAVLPSQESGMSSDVKVYETIVTIDETVEHLKPGMTAIVDVHVQRLDDVVSVPVQTVVQEEGETWCYVEHDDGELERRDIELGVSNDSFVEVLSGVAPNERIVLNPSAVVAPPTFASNPTAAPETRTASTREAKPREHSTEKKKSRPNDRTPRDDATTRVARGR